MDAHPKLYQALSIAEKANLGCALLINLVLLFLIVRRTSKEIGNYRFLLCAFVVNDIFFTIIHAVTLPIACTYGDAFVIFASGLWNSQLSISYYAATFSQTMPLLMHLFIYRFFAMKMPDKTRLYTPLNTAAIVLGTVVVESNIWCWGSYWGYAPDNETVEYLKPFFVGHFEGYDYLAQLYWIGDQFRVSGALITLSFDIFLGTFLAVIIYCSRAIFKHFEKIPTTWSVRTRNLQRQLFHILIVQMVVPMLFVYAPCAGIISLPMAHLGINVFPNLVSFSLTIFPMLDALIVIFGVKSYRTALFSWALPRVAVGNSTHRFSLTLPATHTSTHRASINPESIRRLS